MLPYALHIKLLYIPHQAVKDKIKTLVHRDKQQQEQGKKWRITKLIV
jgi:hypothetical protein